MLAFIYLILCVLYESITIPLAVIAAVPMGLAGCFIFARWWGIENNIYMQIGLIMLIGLLAKPPYCSLNMPPPAAKRAWDSLPQQFLRPKPASVPSP